MIQPLIQLTVLRYRCYWWFRWFGWNVSIITSWVVLCSDSAAIIAIIITVVRRA